MMPAPITRTSLQRAVGGPCSRSGLASSPSRLADGAVEPGASARVEGRSPKGGLIEVNEAKSNAPAALVWRNLKLFMTRTYLITSRPRSSQIAIVSNTKYSRGLL